MYCIIVTILSSFPNYSFVLQLGEKHSASWEVFIFCCPLGNVDWLLNLGFRWSGTYKPVVWLDKIDCNNNFWSQPPTLSSAKQSKNIRPRTPTTNNSGSWTRFKRVEVWIAVVKKMFFDYYEGHFAKSVLILRELVRTRTASLIFSFIPIIQY